MKFAVKLLFFALVAHLIAYTVSAVDLKVNASAGKKPISPNIYGMNWANGLENFSEFVKEIKLPFDRWGGNAVTRYNWKIDASNHASDWFYENIPNDNPNLKVENLPNGSSADLFVDKDKKLGTRTMMTVSLIGWAPKDRERRCGFSVAKYGPQQKTDQWAPDCGNGIDTNGKEITGNDPHDTSMEITPEFSKGFVQHLTTVHGTASNGGVLFYELDNEYDIWQGTHRDVHPKPASTDEIVNAGIGHAAAVKEADPSALVLGPVGWGYRSLHMSGLDQFRNTNGTDRKAHGDIMFGEYYLQQMKAYEDKHRVRILDYYDNHFYPQTADIFSNKADATILAARLRSTQGLWDPNYVDESWIKDAMGETLGKIMFIPRMQKMIADYYPGTKTAITEYNWGGLKTLNGALVQAEVLGIFGREGLDLAALWGPEKPTDPWAYAFRMYRNYDGKGSTFGDTSVAAMSDDHKKLSIFASTRSSDHSLLLVVINKDPSQSLTSMVSINGFLAAGSARVFRYSNDNLSKIVQLPNQNISTSGFNTTFPSYSITLFEIPAK